MGPDDMTVKGLARLEAEVLREHPSVLSAIDEIVAEFAPAAADVEARHGGRQLMAPVQARRTQDYRASANPGLAFLSLLVVLLPALALGISLRADGDFEVVAWAVASILAAAALVCVVKAVSTLRDRVWAGVMPRWAIGGAVVALVAVGWSSYVVTQVTGVDVAGALVLAWLSTLTIVAYAVLTIVRQAGAARAIASDLAPIQPKVDAYLAEFGPKYDVALARIQDQIETIDPNTRSRLKRERDAVIANLSGNRGLYRGQVPLLMNKKELGEFALFAVAEPMLGGGPYPVRSRPATSHEAPAT